MSKEGKITIKNGKIGQHFSPERFDQKATSTNALVNKLSSSVNYSQKNFTWEAVLECIESMGEPVTSGIIADLFLVEHKSAKAMIDLMFKAGVIEREKGKDNKTYLYKLCEKEKGITEGFNFIESKKSRGGKIEGVVIRRLYQKGKASDAIRVAFSSDFVKEFKLTVGDKYAVGFKFEGNTPYMAVKPSKDGYTLSGGKESQQSRQLVFKEAGNASDFIDMAGSEASSKIVDGLVLVKLNKS